MALPSDPPSTASSGTFTPSTGYTTQPSETSTPMTVLTNGQSNEREQESGESSKRSQVNGGDPCHAVGLAGYLWNVGYIGSQWSDVQVTFFDQSINLHRIVLSRSPHLASLMAPHPPGSIIHLSLPDATVSPTSIHIALQHLYTPSLHLIDPSNSRSVLVTAYILGGMPELVQHAYMVTRDSLDSTNIIEYVQWLGPALQSSPGTPASTGSPAINGGPVFGAFDDGVPSPRKEATGWDGGGKYGEWSSRLHNDITDYLVHTLPSVLPDPSSPASDPTLASIYTALPYDLFKSCVESPDLPMPSTQARFTFAKKVIAQRKKVQAAQGTSRGSGAMEEMVLLTVGTRDGSVEITRRAKKGKTTLVKAGPGVSS